MQLQQVRSRKASAPRISLVVPLAGLEPALAAYLALTGYKSAALPIELQGRDHFDHTDIRLQPLRR